MAHPADVARGRNIVARWCNLAEQRLEYLTELFETGRWRRYHTELEFLENIQEANAAVETWRDLLNREASLENTAIDLTWLGRRLCTCSRRRLPQRRRAKFPRMFWSRWKAGSPWRTRRRPCPTRRRWMRCRCRHSISTR